MPERGPAKWRWSSRLCAGSGAVSEFEMATQEIQPAVLRTRKLLRLCRRFATGALTVAAGILVVLVGAGAFLTYRITTAHDSVENVTPASYLLSSYENVNFTDAAGNSHQGWLLIGLRGAPVIFLCHGYGSNRSALLSLGTVLQANHFNVYLFNFDDSRRAGYLSSLGPREASVLRAAVSRVIRLPGINSRHVGVFGTSLGAYAALAAGERDPAVAALAIDGAYSRPVQLYDARLDALLGGAGWLFRLIADCEFHLLNVGGTSPAIQSGLSRLAGK